MYEQWDRNEADPEFEYRYNNYRSHISTDGVLMRVIVEIDQTRRARLPLSQAYEKYPCSQRDDRSPVEKLLDDLVYEANHAHDTVVILADAILAILLVLIELASHYTKEVILTAELRHELQHVAQFHSDYWFLKGNGLHSVADLEKEIAQTESRIAALTDQRSKLRNRIRHETDPQILSDNTAQRAALTAEITEPRKRVKRLQRIKRDTPRLLNLLKAELRAEYALKHPAKKQHREKERSYESERKSNISFTI